MRRRRSNPELRRALADHARRMLEFATGVGDDAAAAIFAKELADLESNQRVVVRASDVGMPTDQGWVRLEVDGSVTAVDEDPDP